VNRAAKFRGRPPILETEGGIMMGRVLRCGVAVTADVDIGFDHILDNLEFDAMAARYPATGRRSSRPA